MIVHLDTPVLVEALRPAGHTHDQLRALVSAGDRPTLCSIVLFEWLRGPRTPAELALREAVLPDEWVVTFGPAEAACAARLYQGVPRPRGREADLAIGACAIEHGAALWTLNEADFSNLPELRLYRP